MEREISGAAQEICNSSLTDLQKGRALRRLVRSKKADSDEMIFNYLCQKWIKVLPFFLEEEEATNVFQKKAPPGRSASYWTKNEELDFYGIRFVMIENWEFMIKKTPLSEKAKRFIEETSAFSEASFAIKLKDVGKQKWNLFMKKCYLAHLYNNCEVKIDDLLQCFFEQIMDEKFFLITMQQKFELRVNNYDGEAKADICVLYCPKEIAGVIVSEDKLSEGTNENEGEAQAIAEAIAVSQQQKWPNEKPVFFFRTRGFYVTFYAGIFDRNFCQLVREGKYAIVPTEVSKYAPGIGNNKGINLLNHEERLVLAEILCSLEAYISEQFN